MNINGIEISDDLLVGVKDTTNEQQWDKFWTAVSANLKERIVSTPDEQLSQLKTKISHVEELRGLFREIFSGPKPK